MDVKEAISQRRSIRSFLDTPVSLDIIHDLIHYANLAPSAGNLQARDFIIVDKKELQEKLSAAAFNQTFIAEAPVTIVVCINLHRITPYGERGKTLYCIQDAASAIEHILLLAVTYGLGTCWVGAFDEKKVTALLHLPHYSKPVALIPIGYPKDTTTTAPPRMNIKNLIHYNKW